MPEYTKIDPDPGREDDPDPEREDWTLNISPARLLSHDGDFFGSSGTTGAAQPYLTENVDSEAITSKNEPVMDLHHKKLPASTGAYDMEACDHERNSMPPTKQEHITLRDAKQVLAELADERKRKKQKKLLESTGPRKQTRRRAKGSAAKVSPSSAQVGTADTGLIRC